MKKLISIVLGWFLWTVLALWTFASPNGHPEHEQAFSQIISGVKFAEVVLTEEDQALVDAEGSFLHKQFATYLKDRGFEYVAITSADKQYLNEELMSYCDVVQVRLDLNLYAGQYFSDHGVKFTTCEGKEFAFSSAEKVLLSPSSTSDLYDIWADFYKGTIEYNANNRLNLPTDLTGWNLNKLTNYFETSSLDPLEGMYEKMIDPSSKDQYRVGVLKMEEGLYKAVYLSGATNAHDWKEGEQIGILNTTATPNMFKTEWVLPNKKKHSNVISTLDHANMMYLSFDGDMANLHKFFKLFPIEPIVENRPLKATGTGVALSQDGYIITNHHVVADAGRVELEIMDDGYPRKYHAVVVKEDKLNDLALLKINDPRFYSLAPLPYDIKTQMEDVGEDVFILGYPRTSTMGKSIKLSKGEITSLNGYQDDVSSYQSSVSVEPGNSGGPLFNSQGRLVGVVKAKHSEATNATYAIKARNIMNLLDLMSNSVDLPKQNQLEGMPLKEQIKKLNDYVFFIKVYE